MRGRDILISKETRESSIKSNSPTSHWKSVQNRERGLFIIDPSVYSPRPDIDHETVNDPAKA